MESLEQEPHYFNKTHGGTQHYKVNCLGFDDDTGGLGCANRLLMSVQSHCKL